MEPLVSIISVCYNHEQYLNAHFKGLLELDYSNIQFIIIDDCSTDNSVRLIEDLIEAHPELNMHFIAHNENKGVCATLNEALKAAKGKYISLIATDDIYMPDFIKNRVSYLETTDESVGMCYSKTSFIDQVTGEEIGIEKRESWPSGWIFDKITEGHGSFCKPFTTMIKKDVYEQIGGYDESLLFEDIDFLFRVARKYQIHFIDVSDTKYRIVKNSLGTKLYSAQGLISLSDIINKHIGVSTEADKNLYARLRKIAIKKYEIDANGWYEDMKKVYEYRKDWKLGAIIFLKKIGLKYNIIQYIKKNNFKL